MLLKPTVWKSWTKLSSKYVMNFIANTCPGLARDISSAMEAFHLCLSKFLQTVFNIFIRLIHKWE